MVVSSVLASVRKYIVSMALVGNDVKFEMFLDRETLQAICTGRVPWYDPEDVHGYRCDGLDPEIFPGKEVPMKFWSPDHRIALEWYARAKRWVRPLFHQRFSSWRACPHGVFWSIASAGTSSFILKEARVASRSH